MVVDSSAVIAILTGEPAGGALVDALLADTRRRMSAATLVEAAIVIEARHGEPGGRELDLFLHRAGIEIVPVTAEQAEIARMAFRRFSKGRHPAGLNYGDCFSYALALASGEPLLFVGDDFARTDVTAAR